jgi:hypothetical protein
MANMSFDLGEAAVRQRPREQESSSVRCICWRAGRPSPTLLRSCRRQRHGIGGLRWRSGHSL